MLSAKVAIDIIFIALIIIAVSITVVVVAQVLTDAFSNNIDSSQAQKMESREEFDSKEGRLVITDPDLELQESEDQMTTFEYALDAQMIEPSPGEQLATAIYGSWPFILPITWGAVGGTLIWRGKVRSAWSRQGYDYDTFRLVTKMRGSPMRIRVLNSISSEPKNKLRLAKELEVDWKTIDNHIEMLLQSRLVEERTVVGTTRYYAITLGGTKVLSLLSAKDDNKA